MGQSYTALYYHAIFATKDRRPHITPHFRDRLYNYIGGIIGHHRGRLLAAGGTHDHVHLLISLAADTSPAEIMRLVKTNSSKWIHETYADQAAFGWQTGYAAFTVSVSNLDVVREYIAHQDEHHRRLSFQDEFIQFLERHGVSYDESYIWR